MITNDVLGHEAIHIHSRQLSFSSDSMPNHLPSKDMMNSTTSPFAFASPAQSASSSPSHGSDVFGSPPLFDEMDHVGSLSDMDSIGSELNVLLTKVLGGDETSEGSVGLTLTEDIKMDPGSYATGSGTPNATAGWSVESLFDPPPPATTESFNSLSYKYPTPIPLMQMFYPSNMMPFPIQDAPVAAEPSIRRPSYPPPSSFNAFQSPTLTTHPTYERPFGAGTSALPSILPGQYPYVDMAHQTPSSYLPGTTSAPQPIPSYGTAQSQSQRSTYMPMYASPPSTAFSTVPSTTSYQQPLQSSSSGSASNTRSSYTSNSSFSSTPHSSFASTLSSQRPSPLDSNFPQPSTLTQQIQSLTQPTQPIIQSPSPPQPLYRKKPPKPTAKPKVPVSSSSSSKPSPHKCTCGRTYQTLGGLRAHSKLHNQTRTFACPSCPKSFLRKQDLKRHSASHEETRPFVCGCGTRFTRGDALGRHVKAGRCKTGKGGSGTANALTK